MKTPGLTVFQSLSDSGWFWRIEGELWTDTVYAKGKEATKAAALRSGRRALAALRGKPNE